jgi:hypothetical protein
VERGEKLSSQASTGKDASEVRDEITNPDAESSGQPHEGVYADGLFAAF